MLGAKARTPAWVSSLCQSRSLLPLQPAWKPAIAAINQTPEVHSMASLKTLTTGCLKCEDISPVWQKKEKEGE